MNELTPWLWRLGPCGIVLAFLFFLYLNPDKAEIWGSWGWRFIGLVVHSADKKAVAYRVQGEVNSATSKLFESAPEGVVEGKLRIQWTTAEELPAVIRGGEVVVFMRRSDQREQNIAKATMLYVPRAIVPRARPYVDPTIMQAVDLIVARSILSQKDENVGSLDAFLREHLDVALAESTNLVERLEQMDEIDLQGWLTRILLCQYLFLGRELYPHPARDAWLKETEAFARWLHALAKLEPGEHGSLDYIGPLLSVAVVFVAERERLATHGLDIYRKRVKHLIYVKKRNAIYLMGRDNNIASVRQLVATLRSDAMIASVDEHEYDLRRDFRARKSINKARAIVVALRRRQKVELELDTEAQLDDETKLPASTYDFVDEQGQLDLGAPVQGNADPND